MKHIVQTIDTMLYCYDPSEFFPVKYDGKLQNKGEYVWYKTRCAAKLLTSSLNR